jgi:mediator of RNA polymerase II transcription subunit 7
MEESQAQAARSSAYPDPPPFYKHFTVENENELAALTKNQPDNAVVEGDLLYLTPPIPPVDGRYRNFGDHWDVRHKAI